MIKHVTFKPVTLYCVFHVEDEEPMLLQAFSNPDEMNEWLFENEGADYNLVIETTNVSVPCQEEEYDDESV